MTAVEQWQLRARFAQRLSVMYGREVPAYTTLVEVAHQVNADVVAARGADAKRLGSLERVNAERHGAIRVGTPGELAQVARVFGAMGMVPTGFYDLRDAIQGPPRWAGPTSCSARPPSAPSRSPAASARPTGSTRTARSPAQTWMRPGSRAC